MTYLEQVVNNISQEMARAGIMPEDIASVGIMMANASERSKGLQLDMGIISLFTWVGLGFGLLREISRRDLQIDGQQMLEDGFVGACIGASSGVIGALLTLEV